ncbi:hypothetical protein IF650_14535 [Cellulosimicrobium terreum]|nr:hypothetical protein [Cellulosimicrobium terreum]
MKPASVEFGERLTVIHGASDTGKSHVFDLINYVFGLAKAIEMPDEGKGYQYAHLGLRTESGDIVTLSRDLTGGPIGRYNGDVRALPDAPASEYLQPKHVSKDPKSVSRYLLSLTELDELLVRTNQYNETRVLQWRDVFRLIAVDEESILSKRSPIEFGQYKDRSVEAAIFRLFIEGRDDSGLTPMPKATELKQISANKLELLDEVLAGLEQEVAEPPTLEELRDQLARLNSALAATSSGLTNLNSERDDLVVRRSANAGALAHLRERQDELDSLASRFELLRAQYDSDLSRLEMLAQATDVLVVGEGGSCPFCGAEPAHQHWPDAAPDGADSEMLAAAIVSEQLKIHALEVDLDQTISAIHAEQRDNEAQARKFAAHNAELSSGILRLDTALKTPGADLALLLDERSRVEREIDAHARLLVLRELRETTARVETPKTTTEVPIAPGDLHRFDTVAQQILQRWSFSGDSAVHYSTSERDLVVDQRVRRVRGKGVRSILHALFNVALADYCLQRDYAHPGFIILDSPIVTYRQPGEPELGGEEETIGTNVVDEFYSYLQNHFSGQSLILENKSPLFPLPGDTREYFFGGTTGTAERAGFYPLRASNLEDLR